MTQEKSHPPTALFRSDPAKKSIPPRRDPSSDLPTDPIRHGKADKDDTKADSPKRRSQSNEPGSRSHSTRSGISQQHAKADSQSHKKK
jgi:hypothetical protein